MLLPTTCPACGRQGPAPCPGCWRQLRPAPPLPPPEGLARCEALLLYAGTGRELVARLKYRNGRSVLDWLAGGMAALVPRGEVDAATWAPTTAARVRGRGFDQAELLARGVASRLGVPFRGMLRRAPGSAQTGLDAAARRAGPRFVASGSPAGRRVLLVDDIVTTGATLSAAAGTLHQAGVTEVWAVVAARTPLKVSAPLSDA